MHFIIIIFVSFFFALIHFLKPPLNCARLADQDIHYFGTGFWTVGQIFAQFDNPVFIAKGFAGDFIFFFHDQCFLYNHEQNNTFVVPK